MENRRISYATIDEYIASFPPQAQQKLESMRKAIREAAPQAEEKISYGMPAFAQQGILVYFAAFKNHIGFYPTANGIASFSQELSNYKGAKGSVQFPIEQPLPLELVGRIVRFRVAENMKAVEEKRKK